jgi:hypothetical protein
VRRLLVTADIPSSLVLVNLMMKVLWSSEMSFIQEPHGIISQKMPFFTIRKFNVSKTTKILTFIFSDEYCLLGCDALWFL